MINVRKLAAVDMALHGARLITAEFALGVLFPLLLAYFSLRAGWSGSARSGVEIGIGIGLLGLAANYVPLIIYAVLIARGGTVEKEGRPELARIKQYNVQQFMLLVPFLVAALALSQEARKVTE